MIRAACAIALGLATTVLPAGARADLVGTAAVVDGDTIEIGGQRVRLHGIDAPESEQMCVAATQWRCGEHAARALDKRIGGRVVACDERDRGPDGLLVAVCRAGGEELNAWIVSEGWALAYRQVSTDYANEEAAARAARRGVWRGSILAPWDWRVSQQAKERASRKSAPERMSAKASAQRSAAAGPRSFTVRAGNHGHFEVEAAANGRSIPFIVDTGATMVTLTRRDAERIGIDPNLLSFDRHVQTANGLVRVAPITLRELRVGPIALPDVQAIVIGGRSDHSLLGMSFLGRLQSYNVSGGTLTMTEP